MQTGLHVEGTTLPRPRSAVVTGATGLIGRWLITELTTRGIRTTALVRQPQERLEELRDWVRRRGGEHGLLQTANLDLDADGLGLDASAVRALDDADVVYHLAARFGFGLTAEVARRANVDAALALVDAIAGSPNLTRFIHISGYRTAGRPAMALDVDDPSALAEFYARHGAYEASKMEAHARVQRAADAANIPLTIVSPAVVIGDSQTGETTQFNSLAETLEQLWDARLPALAGSERTWLPVVPVDFLAQLLARLPEDAPSIGSNLLVFDDRTPALPKLIEFAAARMGVAAPKHILPLGLVERLPQRLTGLDREALSFLSEDRYDPAELRQVCARLDLELPPVEASLARWIDFLVDTRFGDRPSRGGRNEAVAGARVFYRGSRQRARAVLLHGVLLNEHSWAPVTDQLGGHELLVPDLPGLGRSAPNAIEPGEWLTAMLAHAHEPVLLVGHSLGCAFALDYASAHPERVGELVLVSPFFLQRRPGWLLRRPAITKLLFNKMGPERVARALDGELDRAREDAASLMGRCAVSGANAEWLAWAARVDVRARLRAQLAGLELPVTLIVGQDDPLHFEAPPNVTLAHIEGAGHYPQLTHPEPVARSIREVLERAARAAA